MKWGEMPSDPGPRPGSEAEGGHNPPYSPFRVAPL